MRQNCFPAILLKMGTSRRRLSKLAPHALVACNIYVSAGRSHHGDLLLKVLTEAQVGDMEGNNGMNETEESLTRMYCSVGPLHEASIYNRRRNRCRSRLFRWVIR